MSLPQRGKCLGCCFFLEQQLLCNQSLKDFKSHTAALLITQSVLEGYNGTVMAYGQTGTGKTFTLGKLGEEDTADRGIMVRAMEDILANVSFEHDTVSVSYLQVLLKCEEPMDLVLKERCLALCTGA